MADSLKDLYNALQPDRWRKEHPFSDDVKTVHELLFDPYATNTQRLEQISNWFQRFQPCLFGRVAAPSDRLHFCILNDSDFQTKNDDDVAAMIRSALVDWKRRSLRPTSDFSTPAFGFILVAASQRLAYAAPDDHLERFARKLIELWGCEETIEQPSGKMNWETLFLQHPDTNQIYRFKFSVDFFAAQGDGRWWHDHRSPGGLLFTANSVGHMRRYREWYENKKDQQDWVLQTAMLTIAESAATEWGHATWLRPLNAKGKPVLADMACPFAKPPAKKELQGKDWTKYAGWLHTDHSIRPEFFHEPPEPPGDVSSKEYLQDFTYLYDSSLKDYLRFVQGEPVSDEEVAAQIGSVEEWREVYRKQRRSRFGWTPESATRGTAAPPETAPPPEAAERIDALLQRGREWQLSRSEIEDLR